MPYELPLARLLRTRGWKVKIRDRERGVEEPHATITRWPNEWRVSLRTFTFLDKEKSWKQIDDGIREVIDAHRRDLREAWDRIHPLSPIGRHDDE